MRKPPFAVSLLLLLLPLAGCAHQSAGYAPAYLGYDDCDFDSDCYGGFDRAAYSCVFVENPAAPARLAVVVSPQHHIPRVVTRGDWTPTDSSGSPSSSAGAPPQAIVAPPPVPREPVILASPPAEGRSPRAPN
jgi:hypothetical protein